MKMKKWIAMLSVMSMVAAPLAGCGNTEAGSDRGEIKDAEKTEDTGKTEDAGKTEGVKKSHGLPGEVSKRTQSLWNLQRTLTRDMPEKLKRSFCQFHLIMQVK